MTRKIFVDRCYYHVFNKSIANFRIFNSEENYKRFLLILNYYNDQNPKQSLSSYLLLKENQKEKIDLLETRINKIVKIISYCIMPDHYHLLIKVLKNGLIYKYLNMIALSYTRYFNIKFKRKGPLWQSSYKVLIIKNNEQLLHISRYIHLNPTTALLVRKPENWKWSSYREFIQNEKILIRMREISIPTLKLYKKFVENNKEYQAKLKLIKKLLLD